MQLDVEYSLSQRQASRAVNHVHVEVLRCNWASPPIILIWSSHDDVVCCVRDYLCFWHCWFDSLWFNKVSKVSDNDPCFCFYRGYIFLIEYKTMHAVCSGMSGMPQQHTIWSTLLFHTSYQPVRSCYIRLCFQTHYQLSPFQTAVSLVV